MKVIFVMVKLNKLLLALLMLLVLIASVGMVASDDSGSGTIDSGDDIADDEVSYDDESNTGSLDSEDDPGEDPLDEAYYDSDSNNGDSFSVSLAKHATGFPLLILLLALVSFGGLWIRD